MNTTCPPPAARTHRWGPWWPAPAAGFVVASIVAAAYLALVPWDLSSVDRDGNVLANDGAEAANAPMAAVVVFGALLVLAAGVWRPAAVFGAAPAAVVIPVVLFSWRAAVARVIGANLWPVGAVFMGVVATIAVAVAGGVGVAVGLRRRNGRLM